MKAHVNISLDARLDSLIPNHYTTGGVAGVRKISNRWTMRAFAGLTYSRLMLAGLALVAALASPARAQNDRLVLLRKSQTRVQRLHLYGSVLPSGTSIRTGS